MTVGQLEEMPNAEYLQWRAFYAYRADVQDREARKNAG